MSAKLKIFWLLIRQLSGDDAYERYLKNYARYHQTNRDNNCHEALCKADFFKKWQDEKWDGIKRCC